MKFLSLLVPTFAVFSAVSAAPTALSSISKPVEATDPTAVISTLFSTVQEHTAKISEYLPVPYEKIIDSSNHNTRLHRCWCLPVLSP